MSAVTALGGYFAGLRVKQLQTRKLRTEVRDVELTALEEAFAQINTMAKALLTLQEDMRECKSECHSKDMEIRQLRYDIDDVTIKSAKVIERYEGDVKTYHANKREADKQIQDLVDTMITQQVQIADLLHSKTVYEERALDMTHNRTG